jgi:hypothetical protein
MLSVWDFRTGARVKSDVSTRSWPAWKRLAAEFIVIVVGVLVALGVDAARGAWEDQARVAAYLRQLRADLSVTAEPGERDLSRPART